MLNKIVIKGARVHNLKNIDVEIPRDSLVVITGPSGSGKSSLAFDTIYAEGQRRYVESLSAYARQFLEQLQKPDVDSIEGLSPSIAVEQKTTARSLRSTVGTITEIYDYLRVAYTRIGNQLCYKCGSPIATQRVQQIIDA
ncbi:MAG: ATP-binding cassette domain-containing protein, partial [Nitrospirota bacterium]